MGKKIDLSGMKFGRLTVLCENGRKRGEVCWKCKCDCGNIINVSSYSLRNWDDYEVNHGLFVVKKNEAWIAFYRLDIIDCMVVAGK